MQQADQLQKRVSDRSLGWEELAMLMRPVRKPGLLHGSRLTLDHSRAMSALGQERKTLTPVHRRRLPGARQEFRCPAPLRFSD